jgi:hypothetical protein
MAQANTSNRDRVSAATPDVAGPPAVLIYRSNAGVGLPVRRFRPSELFRAPVRRRLRHPTRRWPAPLR